MCPWSMINSCDRNDVTSTALGLALIASTRVIPLLADRHTHSLPSFIFSLHCSTPDQTSLLHCSTPDETSCAMTTNITIHPLYATGSLAFSHFFQWGPMGLCGLAATELAITPTAALHCSTPTGMTHSGMVGWKELTAFSSRLYLLS